MNRFRQITNRGPHFNGDDTFGNKLTSAMTHNAGAKERAIKESLDMSATRYYQLLNQIIDMPDAVAYDPILVKRLQRLRAFRQRERVARRLGAQHS